jgi:hypothetical protein
VLHVREQVKITWSQIRTVERMDFVHSKDELELALHNRGSLFPY